MNSDDDREDADGFDLGDHAEGRFDSWCRDVDIMATAPRKDTKGWDYYLVLPSDDGDSLIDAPPKLNCSVQVKAQWVTSKDPPRIKLSNWERMISEPIPWFICIVFYEKPRTPVRAALVHVDERWTEKVMRQLWKNEAGKKARPRTIKIPVKWGDREMLPAPDGASLLAAIRAQIGDTKEYVRKKLRWREEAGIDDTRHTVEVRLKGEELDYKLLAEVALGEEYPIPLSEARTSEVRFGIPVQRMHHKNVLLTFKPRPLALGAKITFTSVKSGRDSFAIDFDVFSATSVFPFLPPEHRRIRLVSPHLRLDISPSGVAGTTYRWDLKIPDDDVRLADLAQAARAMLVLLDAGSPPAELTIGKAKPLPIDAKAPESLDVPARTLALLDAAANANVTARAFDLSPETIFVHPTQLVRNHQYLKVLGSVFSGSTPDASLLIKEKSRVLDGKEIGYVTVVGSRLAGPSHREACFRAFSDGDALRIST